MKNIFTEKENVLLNQFQVYNLSKLFLNDNSEFISISNQLNFYIHINNRSDLSWSWANNSSKSKLSLMLEEKIKYNKIIKNIYNISDEKVLENYMPKLKSYNFINDDKNVFSYLQRILILNKWQWLLTNKIILDENNFLNYTFNLNELGTAGNFLNNKLENTFSDINAWQKFQSLTKREKEILKLLANGNSTKEISEIYYVSENTVKKHRENINRKIDCNKIHDLIRFADAFQLIGEL